MGKVAAWRSTSRRLQGSERSHEGTRMIFEESYDTQGALPEDDAHDYMRVYAWPGMSTSIAKGLGRHSGRTTPVVIRPYRSEPRLTEFSTRWICSMEI